MKYLYLLIAFSFFSCVRTEQNASMKKVNSYYELAYDLLDAGKSDSSFYLFEKAKQTFLDNKDSLGVAKCLVNMAITQREKGDLFGAQETSLEALKYLDKNKPNNRIYLSTNYNNLAMSSHSLQDYKSALEFFDLAIIFSDDSLNTNIFLNNLALSYMQLDDFDSAVKIYQKVIQKVKSDPKSYARVLSNLAIAKWKRSKDYNPVPELRKALLIREKESDLWGENSSYAWLSDYYQDRKLDSSLYYARKQFSIAKQINSGDDQIKAIERLIKVISPDSVTLYFNQYKLISDSIQQARAAAKNQFALIRYEVEKNKADNLRLEKENAEKQNRLVRQRAITGASIFLLLLAVGGGALWYKRRKQRLELEAQNRVKETQLHLSKKVHDVVANDIYHVMTEVEYRDDLDREVLLDKLEIIYNQSRDISHNVEQRPTVEVPYNEQISTLLKPYGSNSRRISIVGIDAEQWSDVSKRIREEIKHILQEFMVNMKKHSGAERVVVRIEKSDQQLKIFYKDNGVGLPAERPQGKGMANTVSRIESLGGGVIFVSEPGEGLSITVNIPLI